MHTGAFEMAVAAKLSSTPRTNAQAERFPLGPHVSALANELWEERRHFLCIFIDHALGTSPSKASKWNTEMTHALIAAVSGGLVLGIAGIMEHRVLWKASVRAASLLK